MNYAEEIKSRLTARDAFIRYGFEPNRAGFVCCPFHGEKTPSLKVYNDQRGWCCFGCHKGGDVINFVKDFFNLTFNEAIDKINDDFSLGLPIGEARSERQRLADARNDFLRKREIKQREAERQRLDDEYWAAFDRWKRLDENKRKYAPKSPTDELHPLFIEALQNIDRAAYEIDVIESRSTSPASSR